MSNAEQHVSSSLQAQVNLLATISQQLDQLIRLTSAEQSPNYRRYAMEYPAFDWAAIGAEIISEDGRGVYDVEWFGHRFNRRTGERFNEEFIIFSRPGGQEGQYITLIKFVGKPTTGAVAPQSQKKIEPMDIQRTADDINAYNSNDVEMERKAARHDQKQRHRQAEAGNLGLPQLEEMAREVQTAPEFYSLVNAALKLRKDAFSFVQPIRDDPGSDWREKAEMFVNEIAIE